MRFYRPRRAAPLGLLALLPIAVLALSALPSPVSAQTPAKLLLQSVCILGTDQEYVAVYNPTNASVDLSNYYLTDALFTNQGYWFLPDPTKRNSVSSGGGTFNDWHVRFPAGSMIAAGDTVAVSIQGSAAFVRAYSRKPAFEILAAGLTDDASVPNMREAFPGSVPASANGATAHGLTNSGESVTLYYWDQQSDLVIDVDYLVWGNDTGMFRYFNIKTGVTVDGPDGDSNASAYAADTPVAQQSFIVPAEAAQAHTFGNAFRREDYNEGTQATSGGNGIGGRNETSENLAVTWSKDQPAMPPFAKGGGPVIVDLVAKPGGPYTGIVNQAVSFNGSASTPATGETITGYNWNFGDGMTGTGATPTHTYTTAGTFAVMLTVTGSGGGSHTAQTTATITTGEPPPPSSATKLLIEGVCVLGTDQEYVSIYNPTNAAVNLSNYYLTDALFTNQGYWNIPDPSKRNQASSGGGAFNDWHVRFPDGATIAAGDTIAVSIQGSVAYQRAYMRKPHFEIVATGITDDVTVPNMREAFTGSVPPAASGTSAHGLTNTGESVTLYYWDQLTDLVTDIDYVVWGNDGGQFRYFNIKTGVMVDGPDADTAPSSYAADTPVAQQAFFPPADGTNLHAFGNALRRTDFNEGTQHTTGGNGVGGRDETSENLPQTFSAAIPAVPPFVKSGGGGGTLMARPGGPYTGTVNQVIAFNGASSTPATGGSITAYNWTFGDGGSGTGANPTHTYTTAGTFTVTLTVTGSGSTGTNSASTTATVTTDEPPPPSSATKLLIEAVCVLGTDQEYVSIFNPGTQAVNLSNYYLTDAIFTNQGYWNIPDPSKRNQASSGGGAFNDWHVRFPDGASIAAGDTIAVAIQGAAAYIRAYNRKPHFEIVAPGITDDATVPTMREAFTGAVPPAASGTSAHGLTNTGESVTLYYWDQASDLVTDVDYVVWGNDGGQFRYFSIKTGVMVDGPDADTTPSTYKADTPVAQQAFFPPADGTNLHAFGNALRRTSFTEGTQKTTGGNGVGGRDETSENLPQTFSAALPAVPPFVKGSAPPPPGNLTAFISGTPLRGAVGQAISFNGSQSTPKTGETITNYAWTFGDGGTATGAIASHAYATAGTFTATLTVTGSGGGTNSTSTQVSITVPSDGELQLVARTFMPTIGETYPITLDVELGRWQFLRIYDLEGREKRVLLDEQSAGVKKTILWDGRDEELMLVSSGTYIIHLETRDEAGHIQSFSGPVVVARRLERN
ncbi:MAG TPA: PKD domain-containing protein [Candidatus Eisenbacteria bacterium]